MSRHQRPAVLPPKGLLIALVVQTPLIVASLPLRPSRTAFTAGLVCVMAGVALNIWAERLFRRSGVGVCPFTPAPTVVWKGPYRFTRNPMYLGLALINLGLTVLTATWWNLWTTVAFVVWLHYRFVLPEETFLRETIGARYVDYEHRVARWLGIPKGETA